MDPSLSEQDNAILFSGGVISSVTSEEVTDCLQVRVRLTEVTPPTSRVVSPCTAQLTGGFTPCSSDVQEMSTSASTSTTASTRLQHAFHAIQAKQVCIVLVFISGGQCEGEILNNLLDFITDPTLGFDTICALDGIVLLETNQDFTLTQPGSFFNSTLAAAALCLNSASSHAPTQPFAALVKYLCTHKQLQSRTTVRHMATPLPRELVVGPETLMSANILVEGKINSIEAILSDIMSNT